MNFAHACHFSPYDDLSGQLDVRLMWLVQHSWRSGESLEQEALGAFSLWLVEEGALEVSCGEGTWEAGAGEIFLWPQQWPRRIVCRKNARWTTAGLQARLFGRMELFSLLNPPRRYKLSGNEWEKWRCTIELLRDSQAQTGTAHLLRDSLCRTLAMMCWQVLEQNDVMQAAQLTMPPWLRKTLQLADSQSHISVAELGKEAGFSPAQFRRTFARWMNVSPSEYLQQQKLEKARHLLVHTQHTVAEIAAQTGFGNSNHFTRTWRKAYGVTPAAWRQAHRHAQDPL